MVIIKKEKIIEWIVFLIVLFLIWSHVNVVVSNSMYPIMKRGDLVIVENAGFEFNPNDVKVGDIVVYSAHWDAYQYILYAISQKLGYDFNNTLFIFNRGDDKLEAKVLGKLKTDVGEFVIINFSTPKLFEKPVIHRVIDKVEFDNRTYFIIKGDNNYMHDPELVSINQIKQRVLTIDGHPLIIPYLGYLSIYAKEYWYIIVLIIIFDILYKQLRGKK